MEKVLLRTRRRARRTVLALCLTSLVVFCLGWSVLWLFARREAAHALEGLIASEAGHGRQWTCPGRSITGFPLELRLACSGPTFRGMIGGETVDISATGLKALAHLYEPNAVTASLDSPGTIMKAGQDRPAILSWSALTLTARGPATGPGRLEIQVDNPTMDLDGTSNAARHVELHIEPAPGKAAQDHAYGLRVKLDQGHVPALDAAARNTDAVSLDLAAVLTHVMPATREPWQRLVERWRQAGGTCQLLSMNLSKGEMKADAEGVLALDDDHRLWGQLNAHVSRPLVGRVLEDEAVGGSLPFGVSLLLKSGLSSSLAGGPMVPLPVSFADGRVLVALFRTPQRLAPFY